ncbi:unnamed protein product [Cochlearia groenlandica]
MARRSIKTVAPSYMQMMAEQAVVPRTTTGSGSASGFRTASVSTTPPVHAVTPTPSTPGPLLSSTSGRLHLHMCPPHPTENPTEMFRDRLKNDNGVARSIADIIKGYFTESQLEQNSEAH